MEKLAVNESWARSRIRKNSGVRRGNFPNSYEFGYRSRCRGLLPGRALQISAIAQQESHLHRQEQRGVEDLKQVVGQRRPFALEGMADKLNGPATQKRGQENQGRFRKRPQRDLVGQPQKEERERSLEQGHTPIQSQVIKKHHQVKKRGPRVGNIRVMHKTQPSQRQKKGKGDQRNAQEVGELVTPVAVVGGIGVQLVGQALHSNLPRSGERGGSRGEKHPAAYAAGLPVESSLPL